MYGQKNIKLQLIVQSLLFFAASSDNFRLYSLDEKFFHPKYRDARSCSIFYCQERQFSTTTNNCKVGEQTYVVCYLLFLMDYEVQIC